MSTELKPTHLQSAIKYCTKILIDCNCGKKFECVATKVLCIYRYICKHLKKRL